MRGFLSSSMRAPWLLAQMTRPATMSPRRNQISSAGTRSAGGFCVPPRRGPPRGPSLGPPCADGGCSLADDGWLTLRSASAAAAETGSAARAAPSEAAAAPASSLATCWTLLTALLWGVSCPSAAVEGSALPPGACPLVWCSSMASSGRAITALTPCLSPL